jgi:5-methylcytosine-specific restriction endonuclease McrA
VPAGLRRRVQRGAGHRCEYCLVHEEDAGLPHEPDHIIATMHGGDTSLDNLAWSCHGCNNLKSCNLSSIDLETGRVVRLFHPRKDRWSRHFRLEDGHIVPPTAVGRVTEYLLQFNHPENVQMRLALIAVGRYPG